MNFRIWKKRQTAQQQTAQKQGVESHARMGVNPSEANRWRNILSQKTNRFSKRSKRSVKS